MTMTSLDWQEFLSWILNRVLLFEKIKDSLLLFEKKKSGSFMNEAELTVG